MIGVRILGTGSYLPSRRVSTAGLAAEAWPDRDPDELASRTGIRSRRWIAPGESAAQMAVAALTQALDAAGLAARALRRLIFVSSTGGDALCPATANEVVHQLDLDSTCSGFDLNNACTGFLNGFEIAARDLATAGSDSGAIGVVTVETLSPYLAPEVARSYLVFGDAAAAVVLGPGRGDEGILGLTFGNNGALGDSITLAHPGRSGAPARFRFGRSNETITALVLKTLRASADTVLAQAGLTMDDVDWFVPHQPNGVMLKIMLARLKIAVDKTVPMVEETGSIGAASIPLGLDALLRTRPVQPGHRVLMLAIGGGLSWGAILHRVGG